MVRPGSVAVALLVLGCSASSGNAPTPRVRLAAVPASSGRELVRAHAPLPGADLALLRRLASDAHPVDPSHGLDRIDAGGSPAGGPERSATKVCGAEADAEVRRLLESYLRQAETAAQDGAPGILACRELTCTKEPTMEWDPSVTIELARMPDGRLVVRQIRSIDVLLRTSGVDEDVAWAIDEGRKLAVKSCP